MWQVHDITLVSKTDKSEFEVQINEVCTHYIAEGYDIGIDYKPVFGYSHVHYTALVTARKGPE